MPGHPHYHARSAGTPGFLLKTEAGASDPTFPRRSEHLEVLQIYSLVISAPTVRLSASSLQSDSWARGT